MLTLTNAPNGQLRVDQADYVPASVLTNLVVIAAIVQKAIRQAQMEEAALVSVCLKKKLHHNVCIWLVTQKAIR